MMAESGKSVMIRIRRNFGFASVLADILNGHVLIEDWLKVHVGMPCKQQRLAVLVQPRVVLDGHEALAVYAHGAFNDSRRGGSGRKREVKAAQVMFEALGWTTLSLSPDNASVLLTAVAQVAVVGVPVPGGAGGGVKEVSKKTVGRSASTRGVGVEGSHEVGEVRYEAKAVGGVVPVDSVHRYGVLQPEEAVNMT